jgi:hypothetical protein
MQTDYYPSLFDRKKNKVEEKEDVKEREHEPYKTELKTLYEEATVPQKLGRKNFITIFGTTNIEALEEKVRSMGEVKDIEYGRNYLNVTYDSEESSRKLLGLNRQVLDGEIVGVYRQEAVVSSEQDVFVKKKGGFSKLLEYFFG